MKIAPSVIARDCILRILCISSILIRCSDNSIYTGITNDLERRFADHKNKKGGHYTSSRNVEKIIHTEEFATKSEALKREAEIKSWKRDKKLALINLSSPD
ncbi:MAG: GIY-YIG nuclease family protein [Minisyncoccales bacterium]